MFVELDRLLKTAVEKKASDIHITVGKPPILRLNGDLKEMDTGSLSGEDTERYARMCLNEEQYETFLKNGEVDCSMSAPGVSRFRINVFRQRGSVAVSIRVLSSSIQSIEELNLPRAVDSLCELREGLVLVTGPTGSGKSTTVASMVNRINETRTAHILTLEDPIEYLHRHRKSIVNQREIGHDTRTYTSALRAALREDPDVIFVGEMRDLETISTAITAAETGHLVLSTLHTIGAAKTVDRLIDVFPPYQQQQIRFQVSMTLKAVVSQRLIPEMDGIGRVAAVELMVATPAIGNLIREGKVSNINMAIHTGTSLGMKMLDKSIAELFINRRISLENAFNYCSDRENLKKILGMV